MCIRDRSDAERAIQLLSHVSAPLKGEPSPRKILVPVDFSDPSRNAAILALKLAHRYSAELKLLHVFNSPMVDLVPFTDAASIQIDVDVNHQIFHRNAKEKLIKLHKEVVKYAADYGMAKVRIGYSLREGFAGYGIIDMCRRYKPGIVVMGTKSEGFRSTELVGSVAAEVVKETKVPLLVIPEDANLTEIDNLKRVLYVTSLDDKDYMSIRKLASIVSGINTRITCAHVSDDSENLIARAKMDNLKKYLEKVSKKIKIDCDLIKAKSSVDGLKAYIKEHNIDLVALTMHKRNLLERIFNPSLTLSLIHI